MDRDQDLQADDDRPVLQRNACDGPMPFGCACGLYLDDASAWQSDTTL